MYYTMKSLIFQEKSYDIFRHWKIGTVPISHPFPTKVDDKMQKNQPDLFLIDFYISSVLIKVRTDSSLVQMAGMRQAASEKFSTGEFLPAFRQAPDLPETWQPPFRFPAFK